MYIAASHIGIKKCEDFSDFNLDEETCSLIICDGIGEFENSRLFAKLLTEKFFENNYTTIDELLQDQTILEQKSNGLKGGTTIITTYYSKIEELIKIQFLGNGGIIYLYGDFAHNPNSIIPYRYSEIMLPHVSSIGSLTKHFSFNSGIQEEKSTEITFKLNYPHGHIFLFFTDGISSLEEKVILKDNEGRFWRNEPQNIQYILQELNTFLRNNCSIKNFQKSFERLTDGLLQDLRNRNLLEDDASLGMIITDQVLDYYKTNMND
jgi:hypothetical protein